MPTELTTAPIWVRYQLTLLFTDLTGSTRLGRAIEPEHYAEVMAQIRAIWRSAVQRQGGRLVRTQGDGALVIFGHPKSTEEDGRRAAEAALEIHHQVEQLYNTAIPPALLPLQMHSAIHAGTILLAEGDIETGRFDLTGDVANSAAHLANAAAPGQILASLQALGPFANMFELGADPRPALAQSTPQQVVAILKRGNAQNRFEATALRGLTPFIGRQDLVASAASFLAAAPATHATHQKCLVLVGTAGLGKTRLLDECLRLPTAQAYQVLRGGCENYLGAEALQPFVQMLQALRQTAPNTPRIEPQGNTVVGMVGEFLVFFEAFCQNQRVLLAVDDWQWADDASRQLMSALLDLPHGPKVILASRPQEGKVEGEASWILGAQHLRLSPFTEPQTSQAVKRWLPQADPFLCSQIHSYAGGIPLFVEELCHSASVGSLLKTLGGDGVAQTWLASLVGSRLGRLSPELIAVVKACAAIGNSVPTHLLATACGQVPSSDTLDALADADFVFRTGQAGVLRFKHGITRDAVYKTIGLQERTALHQKILNALQAAVQADPTRETVEALSHHSQGAGQWEHAAHYAELAGDKAMASFAVDLANAQYKAALEALDRLAATNRAQSLTWCKVAGKLALTSIFDPLCLGNDLSTFEAAVQKAQDLQDPAALAQATYWLGYLQYGLGHLRAGAATIRQAIAQAQSANLPALVVPFEATLGQILVASCNYDEGLALLSKALETRKQKPGRAHGSLTIGAAYSLAIAGFAYADQGQFDQAHQRFDEAMVLLGGTTHPVGNSVRNFICVSYIWQGNWEAAEQVALASKAIAENRRTLLQLASARGLYDYIQWATGKDRAGLERFKETLLWMDERQCSFYTSLYFGFLAHACAQEGQIKEARQYAFRVVMRRKEGETLGEAMACRAMAKVAAAANNPKLAQRWLVRAERSAFARKSQRERALNHDTFITFNTFLISI